MSKRETDLDLISFLLDIDDGLSQREIEFIESIDRQMGTRDTLTEKQRTWALEIAIRFDEDWRDV